MLTLIDSGCGQHPRWQLRLMGSLAALVSNLINNLPLDLVKLMDQIKTPGELHDTLI
jgi:hypothetical protein